MSDRAFYISQIINKHLKGDTSPEEEVALSQWLSESEEHKKILNDLSDSLQVGEELKKLVKFDEAEGRRRIDEKLLAGKPPVPVIPLFRNYRVVAAAAILLLLCTGAWLRWQHKPAAPVAGIQVNDIAPGSNRAILTLADGSKVTLDSNSNQVLQQGTTTVRHHGGQLRYDVQGNTVTVSYNILTTPRGGQFRLILPDGTRVWLNAVSSLRYPTAFTGINREVEVTGEAYFEVEKNAKLPFIVKINNQIEIEVLGTHFNVNAYTDESALETTLLEGSIKVNRGTVSQVLLPGQQAQIRHGEGLKVVRNANIEQVTAWKNGAFNFDDKTLQEVMRQLARWYDVEVIYEGEVPDKIFSGEMGRELSLSQCLKVLEKMQVHFRIENGRKLIVTQ